MPIITEKIRILLKEKNISQNELARRIGYKHGPFGSIIRGEKPIPVDKILSLANVLEVSQDEIKGWILADKYPKNILEEALKVKQGTRPEEGKLILTTKIDEILEQKGLSRTALSKLIGYSQGKLNQMIKGDEPMSPLVISKIAPVLEVSEDQIKSWTIADKYSMKVLRAALEC